MNKIIIDVREPSEYATGHVVGAINIPPSQMLSHSPELDEIPKDTQITVYCRTGTRAGAAIHLLKNMGFTNLTNGINKEHVERKLLRHIP